jgi:phenylalanyl-tRNA synthetase beta chain
MKVTYKWIKDFVDIHEKPEEVAKRLTSAGMEVEEIIYQNEHLHDVVVGKIVKIEKHPQADKLVVCQVDIGEKLTQIVTSATNVFEGATVPVSLPGADLVNGVKIQPTKFRGVDSFGMFCSGEEIGIDENYFEGAGINGILILPDEMKAGTPIEKALELDDVIFDIGVTPNRADCLSIVGIAREVSAIFGIPMRKINLSYPIDIYSKDTVRNYVNVEVETKNCKRYMAGAVTDVKLSRSPMWMRSRLNAVGIKPINTIVDITNYVLIEIGQPLHAFDQTLIGGNKIIVRQAKAGEKIEALNHSTYELDKETMVIADQEKPMVIAGVIGGTNSCINDDTKTVIFEGANFDLKCIRLTSRRFGVMTDSAQRYSKGVNVANAEIGLLRALHLVDKLGCGKVARGIIDIASEKNEARLVRGSVSAINKILGIEIKSETIKNILNNLGIKTVINGDRIECEVPPYREDIANNNDLAEEVIRIYGYDCYDNIEKALFESASVTEGQVNKRMAIERKLRNMLVDYGFFETVNYSLCPSNICEKLLIKDERTKMVKIINPISEEISCLRTAMAYSLFNCLSYNNSVGNKEARLFECGRTYIPKELPIKELPIEENFLSFVVSENGFDFFHMKGVIENLLALASVDFKLVPSTQPYLHPGISADIVCGEKVIGHFGQVHPIVAKNFDISSKTIYGEISSDFLATMPEKRFVVKAVPKYPVVERDLAVVVDERVSTEELIEAIKSACGKLLFGVKLFDIYRSSNLGEGKKSMAFNIKLSDESKTLTDEEVSKVINKALKSLTFRFGASLR